MPNDACPTCGHDRAYLREQITVALTITAPSDLSSESLYRREFYDECLAAVLAILAPASPSVREDAPSCCADKGGAFCRDTTGLDHCMTGHESREDALAMLEDRRLSVHALPSVEALAAKIAAVEALGPQVARVTTDGDPGDADDTRV